MLDKDRSFHLVQPKFEHRMLRKNEVSPFQKEKPRAYLQNRVPEFHDYNTDLGTVHTAQSNILLIPNYFPNHGFFEAKLLENSEL
jgi:hypothetical protein